MLLTLPPMYMYMYIGVRGVMSLADPLGVPSIHRELDRGLVLKRLTVPLGMPWHLL
jgi:gamma-glutamyl phosphate reductase